VFANRVRREGEDFPFMLGYPVPELSKRDFVLFPVAVGQMDGQPISASFSKRLAVREFEEGSSDTVGLRMDLLRHGIDAAAMVQLIGIVHAGFPAEPFG
jgi:hypothetical protein